MPEDELSLWADDRSLDAKLAVLETQGEFFSLPPLLEEVVWFEPRDSTDQEDRSSDLSKKRTHVLISYHKCRRYLHLKLVISFPDSESIDCNRQFMIQDLPPEYVIHGNPFQQ
jgi:hypothetical protein